MGIPNVPGVPPLASYAPNTTLLVIADAVSAIGAILPPPWAIVQATTGLPVFLPKSVLAQAAQPTLAAFGEVAALLGLPNLLPAFVSLAEFEYSAESPISTYPQEQGAFQSYDKVQLPFDVKVQLVCDGSPAQRQSFISALDGLRTTIGLVNVVTPEFVYYNVNCTHVSYRRTAHHGVAMIVADTWFEQVPVTATVIPGSGTTTNLLNTQQPGDAAVQSIGGVQPYALPAPVSSLALGFR